MINDAKAKIEAILFSSGEPVPVSRLCEVLELAAEDIHKLADDLSSDFEYRHSALEIIKVGSSFQMCTRSDFSDIIRQSLEIRRNVPLSNAAFEVLAVIAYNQPVTRAFVDQVRGVDCSGVITSLSEKGLIEEKGRLELPGRPLLYGTTENFLRCFGVPDIGALPPIPKHEDGENDNQLTFDEGINSGDSAESGAVILPPDTNDSSAVETNAENPAEQGTANPEGFPNDAES